MKSAGTFALLAALAMPAAAAAKPPLPARALLGQAELQAARRHQNVFLIFGASWCAWCKMLEVYLQQPQVEPVMQKQFTFLRLSVEERGALARRDNPGAGTLMKQLGGTDGSLPYMAILTPQGKLVVNSLDAAAKPPGGNIGYPVQPNEIAWFFTMLRQGAPRLQPAELKPMRRLMQSMAKMFPN